MVRRYGVALGLPAKILTPLYAPLKFITRETMVRRSILPGGRLLKIESPLPFPWQHKKDGPALPAFLSDRAPLSPAGKEKGCLSENRKSVIFLLLYYSGFLYLQPLCQAPRMVQDRLCSLQARCRVRLRVLHDLNRRLYSCPQLAVQIEYSRPD